MIEAICHLGNARRCAAISYIKQTGEYSERVIEPYTFQRSGPNLMILSFQVDPAIVDDTSWRNFRIDRINRLSDAGCAFAPRRAVDLSPDHAREFSMDYEPGGPLATMNEYMIFIGSALLDGKFTNAERGQAASLASRLSPNQVRAVHAQAMKDALQECLLDGEISEVEAEYLSKVRRFLKRVGWAF